MSRRKGSLRPADRGAGELEIFLADSAHSPVVLGKRRRLIVKAWSTVADLKRMLGLRLNITAASQQLFFRDKELKNTHSLQDAGVCRSGEVLTWSIVVPNALSTSTVRLEPCGANQCPKNLFHALLQGKRALLLGKVPVLSIEGTGGCYFIPDTRGNSVAVFKPRDEEPYMPNNPREAMLGLLPASPDDGQPVRMRHGIGPGGCCFREIAAYLLDTGHFARVPQTTLVECLHPKFSTRCEHGPKIGSFQAFALSDGVADDFSESLFPVHEVHRIALLDIRILNCDRNAGNLLVRRNLHQSSQLSLVPIDHGYCLPEELEIGWCDWCWLDWPQCKEPLSDSTREYVLNVVDPEADAALVKSRFPELPETCLVLLKLAGMLLQHGCRAGLSVFDIASMIVRNDCFDLDIDQGSEEARSELENIYHRAHELASSGAACASGGHVDDGKSLQATNGHRQSASPELRTEHDDNDADHDEGGNKEVINIPGNQEVASVDSDSEEGRGFWVDDMAEAAKREQGCVVASETTTTAGLVDTEWHVSDDNPSRGRRSTDAGNDVTRKGVGHESKVFWRFVEALLEKAIAQRAAAASTDQSTTSSASLSPGGGR